MQTRSLDPYWENVPRPRCTDAFRALLLLPGEFLNFSFDCYRYGCWYQFGCNYDDFTFHWPEWERFVHERFIQLYQRRRLLLRAHDFVTKLSIDSLPSKVSGWPAFPLIVVDDFLSCTQCSEFIRLHEYLKTVGVLTRTEVHGRTMTTRNSYQSGLPDVEVVQQVRTALIEGFGIVDSSSFEVMQITGYNPGGHYKVHHDGHQRVFTFLMYINEGFEGGATTFPMLGCSVTPKAGRLVAWMNTTAKGTPKAEMLHYAEPVLEGEKIVVQQWTDWP